MISRRILAAVAVLCALVAPAHAQKTKAQLATEIGTTFPDNTSGQITPAGVRAYETDVINSIMPTAPVVSGNLACFNGTTGLLQDCGASAPLIVGTTTVSSGTSYGLLFNNAGLLGNTAPCAQGQDILPRGTGLSPSCAYVLYNVQAFGATGNASTDDTAAIQAAINAAQTLVTGTVATPCVYLPRATNGYLISSTLTWTKSPCMVGDGGFSSVLYAAGSSVGFPYITIDTGAGNELRYGNISGIACTSANVGARTSESCLKVIGSGNLKYSTIANNLWNGVYRGLWTAGSGTDGAGNQIRGNVCANSGANSLNDCIYMPTGGLGGFISNNILSANANCILMVGIGDIVIVGNQGNSCTNGLNITSNTSHIQSVGNEWDAGVTNAYNLTSVGGFYADDLIGGAVGMSITTPTDQSIRIKRKPIVPVSLTAGQNNYTFGGLLVRALGFNVTPNGTYNITGFAGSGDAQDFYVYNAGAFNIGYNCNDAASTAANRIACNGTNEVQRPGELVYFTYNMSTLRWNIASQPFNATLASIAGNGLVVPTLGGTGVANADTKTITLGGALTTSGAFASTLTMTGVTSITLPTTGTLATLAGTEILTGKTMSGASNTFTNIPISTAISGLGTGVATALGVNVGSAGAVVVNGGALGSPSSVGTMPAFGLGGAISGGGNQINNVIIGTSTPLAGFFTSIAVTSEQIFAAANSGFKISSTNGTTFQAIVYNTSDNQMTIGTQTNHPVQFFTNNDLTGGFTVNADGTFSVSRTTAATSSTVGALKVAGGGAFAGAIWAGTYVATTPTTVAGLTACAAGTKGARMFVTDANAAFTAGIGAVVAAGGANNVPVTCDGTNWRIGANDNIPATLMRKFA